MCDTFGARHPQGSSIRPPSTGRCLSSRSGYTPGMKTAISIPDDLFADAERLAQALHKSRSRLFGDALREYVARHSADEVTEALDRVWADTTSSGSDFAARAARRTLHQADW